MFTLQLPETGIIGRPLSDPLPIVSENKIQTGSLVLYKIRPAIVESVGEKYEIRFEDGRVKRVRQKDIRLLHPGPARGFDEVLEGPEGDPREAWELLQGETVSLAELAELIYGDYTPAAAWAAWQLLQEDLWFEGSVNAIRARDAETVARIREERERKAREAEEQAAFLERLQRGELVEGDRQRLQEVERVALGRSNRSRILASLDLAETPEAAHALLLRSGHWPEEHNPWPERQGALLESPDLPLPSLPEEERRDLTHLEAWAIDDEGNTDPDDAISLEGDRIWVHVADVAALVRPDSHLDLAARERSANLYLPERTVSMLPPALTDELGLGLQEISPALSFGFRLGAEGKVEEVEITPSWIRARRISYEEADQRLQEPAFAGLHELTRRYREARRARNAAEIELPEVNVKVVEGEVVIRPLPRLDSRRMVTDAMLMAGEAAARYSVAHGIAIPFAVQPEPEEIRRPSTMAEAYAYRRLFRPSNAAMSPDRHFGLGLELYARATSPLRRYMDLVVHQQVRAHVTGGMPLGREQVSERVAAASAVGGVIRRSERLSNLHWKLIWLKRHPDWRGEAVVVALEERKAVVIIPQLALEARIRRSDDLQPDRKVMLQVQSVDLPAQAVHFRRL